MAKGYLSNTTATLTGGGGNFDVNLAITTGTPGSQTVGGNPTDYGSAFTGLGDPGTGGLTGDYTVEMNITTANSNVEVSCQIHRVNSTGTVQSSSSVSTPQSGGTTGVKTFNFTALNLGTWNTGDRIRVDYIGNRVAGHGGQTVTIQTLTTNAEVYYPRTIVAVIGLTTDTETAQPVTVQKGYPPVVASSASNTNSGAGNFTVTKPSGTVDGDLLIGLNISDWSTLAASALPTGFTELTTADYDGGSNATHIAIGYKVASSEPASYTFTGGSASDNVGILLRLTGADSTPTIVEVAPNEYTTNQTSVVSPTVTPTAVDDILLCFFGADGGGAYGTWPAPTGMTKILQAQSRTFTAGIVAYLRNPSSPTGTKTWNPGETLIAKIAAGSISIAAASTSGQQIAIGQAAETDRTFILTKALTVTTDTETAQPVTASKTYPVGQAAETDAATALTHTRAYAIGQAAETDTAQPVGQARAYAIGQATETDTAQPVASSKVATIGQATETDAATALASTKTRTLGQATETDAAQPVTVPGAQNIPIFPATETDIATGVGTAKAYPAGQAVETDTPQPLGSAKAKALGQAVETDTANPVGSIKFVPVGTAQASSTAQPVTARKTVNLGLAAEAATAQPVTGSKQKGLGAAQEADTALPVGTGAGIPLGQATETDLSQPVTASKAYPVAGATETDTATVVIVRRGYPVGLVTSTHTAQPLASTKTKTVGSASETDAAQPLSGGSAKNIPIGQTTETDTATVVTRLHSRPLGQATGTGTAQALTRLKEYSLGQAAETDFAQPVAQPLRRGVATSAVGAAPAAAGASGMASTASNPNGAAAGAARADRGTAQAMGVTVSTPKAGG